MERESALCDVNIYLRDTSTLINRGILKLNSAELEAINISKCVHYDNKYYDVENMDFDCEFKVLEIFVKD
ncbi:hypothetical protein [Clostridium tyrobutyricum]|uniref:hypothetical protein n=1 Tax=Clostridium tyrobutyricum TaxID=1519 RepID=UPI001C387728|nr:hypothetical protein [Clostridium tyrobutyricum]MBV4417132.1 hypothetical protein [Clostridium tyrobutyricum]